MQADWANVGRGSDKLKVFIATLGEARELLAAWRDDYNRVRPHSALANRTPEEFRDHHRELAATTGSGQDFNPGLSH